MLLQQEMKEIASRLNLDCKDVQVGDPIPFYKIIIALIQKIEQLEEDK